MSVLYRSLTQQRPLVLHFHRTSKWKIVIKRRRKPCVDSIVDSELGKWSKSDLLLLLGSVVILVFAESSSAADIFGLIRCAPSSLVACARSQVMCQERLLYSSLYRPLSLRSFSPSEKPLISQQDLISET